MKRTMVMAAMAAGLGVLAATAEAGISGIAGKAVSFLTGEVVALLVSAAVAVMAGAFGVMFVRVARTFREAGEFLTVLGCALDDRRITREELAGIVREGKEVFSVWK